MRGEGQFREAPAEERRVGEPARRIEDHQRRGGSCRRAAAGRCPRHAAADVEGAVDVAVVGRGVERVDLERAAEAMQIEAGDAAGGSIADRRRSEVEGGGGAVAERRPFDDGAVQRRRAVHGRPRTGDVIFGRRNLGRERRHAGRGRQLPQIDPVCPAGEVEGQRPPRRRRDDEAARGRGAAIGGGAAVERDARSGERAGDLDIARLVARGAGPRAIEGERSGQPIQGGPGRRLRLQRQVYFGMPGDVALLRRILEQRREVDLREVDIAAHRDIRRLRIGGDLALNLAGFGGDVEVERQRLQRPLRLDVDRGMKIVAGGGRDEAADLRQRDVPGGRDVQSWSAQVFFDDAVDRQRRFSGLQRELLDVEIVVALRQHPGEVPDRERRGGRLEVELLERDGVVHRLVLEGRLDVETRHLPRQFQRRILGAVVDRHRGIVDFDRRQRDRPARPLAIRLLRRRFDQPGNVPALRVPHDPQHRPIELDLIEDDALRGDFEHAVIELDRLDGNHPLARDVDRDIGEVDAEQQVAAETADRLRSPFRVLLRFADDIASQPVLEPRRLRHDQGERDHPDHERADEGDHLQHPADGVQRSPPWRWRASIGDVGVSDSSGLPSMSSLAA